MNGDTTRLLFPDLPESLSPFAAWKVAYGIITREIEVFAGGCRIGTKWEAASPDLTVEIFNAASEEEACWSLALACDLPHWKLG